MQGRDFSWESSIHPPEVGVYFLLVGFWTSSHEAEPCEDARESKGGKKKGGTSIRVIKSCISQSRI